MIGGILLATLIVGGVGLFVGLFLGVAGIKFSVEVNPVEEAVLSALPGNNCGGCGFPGCSGLAAAIAGGEAPVNGCPVGGEPVANKIAEIMGVEATSGARMVAFVKCQGDCDKAKVDYSYSGTESCAMMSFVPGGGPKSCNYGCMGNGDCVAACPFDAIHVENGIARVDKDKCKACEKCIKACPKNIIELVPYDNHVKVACNSKDKGAAANKVCSAACIGCGICQKNCPSEAIAVDNFLAAIDYGKCTQCGICMEKCPKGAIIKD